MIPTMVGEIPPRRGINWSLIIEMACYVLVFYLLLFNGGRNSTPAAMRFWYGVQTVCQHMAYVWGKAGIEAEKAYWAAVERARA